MSSPPGREGPGSTRNAEGMLLMLLATGFMVCMHTAVRFVSQDLPVSEVVFFRNLFALLTIIPIVYRGGFTQLRSRRPMLHLLRSGIGFGAMWLWFYALSVVPVADATALSFISVVFGSIAAALLLGERMRLRRWSAVGIGFAGALVILRPGFQEVNVGMLAILASSLFWSLALVSVKYLSRFDSVVSIVAINTFLLSLFSLVPALMNWQTPTPGQLGILVAVGVCATFGHLLMGNALKIAEASVVFPVDFARLVWATLLGLFVFNEVPDAWTFAGGAVIFASTAYITYRESRIRRLQKQLNSAEVSDE